MKNRLTLGRRFGEPVSITDAAGNTLILVVHKGEGQQIKVSFEADRTAFTILRGELLERGRP